MEKQTNNGSGQIQAVIFDLDGVLVDSEWAAFLVWRELAESYGGTLGDDAYSVMVGMTAEETAEYVMRRANIHFNVSETVAWAWKEVTARLKTQVEPLPGALELVGKLTGQGYPLAIASNSPLAYIDTALGGLGLTDHFPVRIGSDMVKQGKPAPDVYLKAAEKLGTAPQHCLAIEDSRVGVQAAHTAGMRVLAVPGEQDHHNGFHGAWGIYHNLLQVGDKLEELLK
jgi:HAD superfamily hydrolase (TIGR01509 family)